MTGKNCTDQDNGTDHDRKITAPWKMFLFSFAVAPLTFLMMGCDVDVNDPGELPDVDVEGGRAPDVDVTTPEVDVEMKEKTIEVPDVDVDVPEENEQ